MNLNKKEKIHLHYGVFSEYRPELMGLAMAIIMVFHWCENYTILLSDWNSIALAGGIRFFITGMTWIGACGVEAFLFLSGIGLYYSFSKKPDAWAFYKKRFITVLVPYNLIAVPYLLWQNFIYTQRGLLWFLKDWTLLTTFTSFNRQGWYVALILVCYVLFPLFYYTIKRLGNVGFALSS